MGIFTPKCQACGQKNPEVVQHRNGLNLCPNCVGHAEQHAAKLSAVLLSTGEIGRPHEIIQVLMHIGTGLDGWDNVFARTMTGLQEDALKLGADAILSIRIEHRIFVENVGVFFSQETAQGIEFFAYGTAVRYT